MAQPDNPRLIHVTALVLLAVLIVHVMVEARLILLPLAWALFISILILPVVRWLEVRKMPRSMAIISVLVVVTAVLSLTLYMLSFQVVGLLGDVPEVTRKLDEWVNDLQNLAESNLGISHEVMTRQLSSSLSEMVNTSLLRLRNSLFSVFQTLTLISVIPLYIFFMLYYRDLFHGVFLEIAKNFQAKAGILINRVNRVVQQYLAGLMAVTAILVLIFYITLSLLGIGYALFFAVFLAVFNLIPYIGVVIASLAVIMYTIATKDSLFYPTAVLLLLWLIQLIENNIITPFILGSRVKVNPMVALIAIFAGASIWGVSGMILFIPLVGVLKIVFDEIEGLKPLGLLLGGTLENPTDAGKGSS